MSYYHGLISDELFNTMNANCDLAFVDAPIPPNLTDQCQNLLNKFNNLTSLVNIYDIFGKCYITPEAKKLYRSNNQVKAVTDAVETSNEGLTAKKYSPFLERYTSTENLKVVPPCIYAEPVL